MTTRGVEVPLEHVTAELAAFPLASTEAARLSLIAFDTGLRGETGQLWRAAERAMVRTFPSFSIDELIVLRDWLWFNRADDKPFSMAEYLRAISNATLEFSGNVFRPKMPPWAEDAAHSSVGAADAHARHFWRWVSFALPPDLLMAAHETRGAVAAEVELVSPILARILHDRGFVEPHMHVTAALDFSLLWIAALHALAHPDTRPDAFRSPGAEGDEGADLGGWLLRAAIARYVLAAYLRTRRDDPSLVSLDMYLLERASRAMSDPSLDTLLRFSLRELAYGRVDHGTSFAGLQRLYARLTRLSARWPGGFPDSRTDASHADPIDSMFPARGPGQRTSEMEWIAESLAYLSGPTRPDAVYARLFWQIVRVRNRFYRHVVQRPMTPGLQWFVRFFARMKPARRMLKLGLLVENAAAVCGIGRGLRAMEFRTSPDPDTDATRLVVEAARKAVEALTEHERAASLRAARRAASDRPGDDPTWNLTTEYGLVLHLSRDRGGRAMDGLPGMRGQGTHADPSAKRNFGYRYAWYYKQKRREAVSLARLISRFPRSLRLFRGIDLCTDELGIPTWVLSPLCRYVREVSKTASAHLQSTWVEDLAPLRVTVHAGEDFVHLLGGLRRIDEAIDLLKLGQGDRIGHGMALGINAQVWARRTSGIAIPKMERLLDLAWEWSFSTSRGVEVSARRIQYVIDRIERLTQEVFKMTVHPPQVAHFATLLARESELRRLDFPHGPLPDMRDYLASVDLAGASNPIDRRPPSESVISHHLQPWELLRCYLSDPGAFQRGQKTELVDPAFEAATLEVLQDELRRKIAAAGITVEINPSSNLLIGNLGDLKNHPLWRLKPPRGGDNVLPVAVCIGSDNPLTFATRTREEYQLVYDTLTLAGLSDIEARQWLEEARESGLASRFTLPGQVDWSTAMWASMDVDISTVVPLL